MRGICGRANRTDSDASSDVGYIGEIARELPGSRWLKRPYLTEDEVQLLAIPRGSLGRDERREIGIGTLSTAFILGADSWTREYKRIQRLRGPITRN